MQDFLQETTSAELTGWLAYLSVDDEVQMQRMVYATVKAFGGGQAQAQQTEEDEPVIDTTSPDFVKNFKGFTGMPGQQNASQRIPRTQANTQILMG